MSKNIKSILIVIAAALIFVIAGGLIIYFARTDKGDETQKYEISGKVYDDSGNEMLSTMVYVMPNAMTISDLQNETISHITISATVSPEDAIDRTVTWSIVFEDGFETDGYLTIEPTYNGSNTAVLTCYKPFAKRAIITATSNFDETKKATCYVDYLSSFDPMNLSVMWDDIAFNEENLILMEYNHSDNGTVEGYVEYGNLYLELDDRVVHEISKRLGKEFAPTPKILSKGYSSDEIEFNVPSPFACFAANSGFDEKTFNDAFVQAIYFGCGENCDYHAIIHFTARYSYKGCVAAAEDIWHDGSEVLSVIFSLEGLVVPVDDVTINSNDIAFGVGIDEPLVCTFDGAEKIIVTDGRIAVAGKQMNCPETTVTALGKTFTRCLNMERGTLIRFATDVDFTLKIYVDAEIKKIKVDGVNYTSILDENGDCVVTMSLPIGMHSITIGDAMGIYALTLNN